MESRNRGRGHHREKSMTDQFQLTDDQLAIQDMARKFTADRITPFAAEWDEKHHYPVDVWKAAGELGFGAIYVAEESGGIGLGRLEAALIRSEEHTSELQSLIRISYAVFCLKNKTHAVTYYVRHNNTIII